MEDETTTDSAMSTPVKVTVTDHTRGGRDGEAEDGGSVDVEDEEGESEARDVLSALRDGKVLPGDVNLTAEVLYGAPLSPAKWGMDAGPPPLQLDEAERFKPVDRENVLSMISAYLQHYPRGSSAYVWSDNRVATLDVLMDVVDTKRRHQERELARHRAELDDMRRKLAVQSLPHHVVAPQHADSFRFH